MINATVCLKVEGTLPIPSYVRESIDLLHGYPVKFIIVCDGATTHTPGPCSMTPYAKKSMKQFLAGCYGIQLLNNWYGLIAELYPEPPRRLGFRPH